MLESGVQAPAYVSVIYWILIPFVCHLFLFREGSLIFGTDKSAVSVSYLSIRDYIVLILSLGLVAILADADVLPFFYSFCYCYCYLVVIP